MATPKKKKNLKAKKVVKKQATKKTAPKKMTVAAKSAKPSLQLVKSSIDWKRQLHPLQDRIVVTEIAESLTTPGGLILIEADTSNGMRGKVVAVGNGRVNKKGKLRPLDVKVGDVVLLSSHTGSKVTVGSQDAWIVREEDVLGVCT